MNTNPCIRLLKTAHFVGQTYKNNVEMLKNGLNILGEWVVENGLKINPGKTNVMRLVRPRVKDSLVFCLGD